MASTNLDVIVRLKNARAFQREVIKSGAELEAMGIKGASAMTKFAAKAERLKSFGKTWTRNVTLPVAAIGFVAGKVAVDFDASMRNVNSIAKLPEKQLKALSASVLEISKSTNQDPTALAEGLYDLVSSGFSANESLGILTASAKAATAGLTDTATSTKTVAAVLNAYHLPAKKAGDISDSLFKIVDQGVISFEELSTTIGDVLPFASSLGVSLDDVGGSISTMTKAGIGPAETMTRIKALMSSLLKPSKDLSNQIKDLGYDSGESMIKALGFQGTLDALAKATGGSKEELAKLFPNVRALGGALALTGENAKGAHKDLKAMADHAGSTDRALSQQSKSFSQKARQMGNDLKVLAIKIAPRFLDAGEGIIKAISGIAGWFSRLSPGLQNAIVNFALLAASVGPLVSIIGYFAKGVGRVILILPKLITLTKSLAAARSAAAAVAALNVALGTTALTVRGLLISTGIGALIVAIVLLNEKFHFLGPTIKWIGGALGKIKDVALDVIHFIGAHWKLLLAILTGPFGLAVGFVVSHFGDIVDFFKKLPGRIGGALSGVWGKVTQPFKSAFEWIVDKIQWALDKIGEITDKLDDINPFVNPITGGSSDEDLQRVINRAKRSERHGGSGGGRAPKRRTVVPKKAKDVRLPLTPGSGAKDKVVHHKKPAVLNVDGKRMADVVFEWAENDEALA